MQYFLKPFFADAEDAYEDSDYVIFGVPYDGTTSYLSGTRLGPKAIREASWNFETYLPDFDLDFSEISVCDMGDLEISTVPEIVICEVESAVRDFTEDNKFPVILGGEHSLTIGALNAIRPECYVVGDAHLDLRDEFGSTPFNHACVTRRAFDMGAEIFIVGARSGPAEEFRLAGENERIHLYTPDDVRRRGIDRICDEIISIISGRKTYLSIDADAIDCCLTPGLGTPEPFGLDTFDIRDLVRKIGPYASAFDYVEVCPTDSGQTATVAAKIIREFIAVHSRSAKETKKGYK